MRPNILKIIMPYATAALCMALNCCGGNGGSTPSSIDVSSRYISGYIMATNGNPLTNVSVSLTRVGKATLTAYTNSSGYYYFGDLGQETCTIAPSLTGYAFDPNLRDTTATASEMSFTAIQIAKQVYGLNFNESWIGKYRTRGP